MNLSLSKTTKQPFFVLFIFILTFTYFQFFSGVKVASAPTPPVCQPITTTINQAPDQIDPTGSSLIKFKVGFSSPITPTTFLPSQIELTGTAPDKTVTGITEIAPNDGTTFEVGVATTGSGSVIASVKETTYVSSILGGVTGSYYDGITFDSYGNIFITNFNRNTVSKITPAGVFSTLGTTGTNPVAITFDSLGNIYTANQTSENVTKITPSGVSITLGTTGSQPKAITIDASGNVYTANYDSNNVTKITPSGVSSILGPTGSNPLGITIDSLGNIYTSNRNSNNVTKITPSGVSTILGTTGSQPFGIISDPFGNVYTANSTSNNVTKITPSGVSSILGPTGSNPLGITIDSLGNIYTSNYFSSDVTKITSTGVSSIIGTTNSNPRGIIIDQIGNIYTANNFGNITKLTKTGASISTFCKLTAQDLTAQTITLFAQSSTSTDNTVTIDTTQPPITGTPDLAPASDTGISSSDNITNDTTPTFDISCLSGSTVTLYNGSNPLASKLCPVENTVSITPTNSLTNGTYTLYARQTNPLGVVSNISEIINVTIDTSAPAAPLVNAPSVSISQTPTISGQCEADAGILALVLPTNEIVSGTCGSLNVFAIYPIMTIPLGPYSVSVTQKDIAGNTSLPGLANGTIVVGDSDGDLVPDYIEAIQGTDPANKQNYLDSDGDLVPDYIETLNGTNPNDKTSFLDTDGGGAPDYVETIVFDLYGLQATSITNSADDKLDIDGDGLTDYQEIILGSSLQDPDMDRDGVMDGMEANGPNNGDFNNDGISDFRQPLVRGLKGLNNEFFGFVTDTTISRVCPQAVDSSNVTESSLSTQDAIYTYPKGLINYTVDCIQSGSTITVDLYFSNQTDSPNLKVRKFKNGVYGDVSNAVKTQLALNGIPTVKVTYDITDGGELDEDGLVNGKIVDPVGLALLDTPVTPIPPTPNTGPGNGGDNTSTAVIPSTTTLVTGLIRTGGRD
jgi:streptogramin lyase